MPLLNTVAEFIFPPQSKVILSIVLGLSTLLAFLVLTGSIKAYQKWKTQWLSSLVNNELRKSRKVRQYIKRLNEWIAQWQSIRFYEAFIFGKTLYFQLINEVVGLVKKTFIDIRNLHLPSIASFSVFLILFGALFYLSHEYGLSSFFELPNFNNIFSQRFDEVGVIVAVLAGLSSLIFALVIFVAESIRDGSDEIRNGVFLRESKLWFLVTFTILALINFLWTQITVVSILFPIIIAAFAIVSFGRIIKILKEPQALNESKRTILEKRLQKSIQDSIKERIGNNILLRSLGIGKDIPIEYTISKKWIDKRQGDYVFVECDVSGIITDIHLGELEKLANYLEREANSLGFSIMDNSFLNPNYFPEKVQGQQTAKKAYLLKRYKESVPSQSIFNRDGKIVFAIPEEFKQVPHVIPHIRRMISRIFVIKDQDSPSEKLREDLASTKDRLIHAIKNTYLGEVMQTKNLYLHMAEEIIVALNEAGGRYSAEDARKERQSLWGSWNELSWLREDISELLPVAVESYNKKVVSSVAFLPIAIAIRAIEAKDHLLFQEMILFAPYFYSLAISKDESSVQKFMIERSWRYPKEIFDFYIEKGLEEEGGEVATLREYKHFAEYALKTFQSLLKIAFEEKRVEDYKQMISIFNSLLSRFDPSQIYPRSSHYDYIVENAATEKERSILVERKNLQEEKEDIGATLRQDKREIVLGLSSFIFEKLRHDKDNKNLFEFYSETRKYLPSGAKDLTEVYLSARKINTQDFWGWDNWEIVADEQVHQIDFESKLDRVYVVETLNLLGELSESEAYDISLPHNRELAHMAEPEGGLINLLQGIETNKGEWSFIITENGLNRIEIFKTLLRNAKELQEQSEQEELKSSQLSNEKVYQFFENFDDEFNEMSSIRQIFNSYDAYEQVALDSENYQDVSAFGFNQILEKGAFVEDWPVTYVGIGEQFGRAMANSENEQFLKKILSEISNEVKTNDKHRIAPLLLECVEEIDDEQIAVIHTLDPLLEYDSLRNSEKFIDRQDSNCPEMGVENNHSYIGVLKHNSSYIPVFSVFVRDDYIKNIAIVAPVKQLGKFLQVPFVDTNEDQEQENGFIKRVIDLSEDESLRNDLIARNPEWLQEIVDKEGYLRQKVVVKILEKFIFGSANTDIAYKVVYSEDAKIE